MRQAALKAHMERKYSLLTQTGRKIWSAITWSTCYLIVRRQQLPPGSRHILESK